MCHWSPDNETLILSIQELKEKNNKLTDENT